MVMTAAGVAATAASGAMQASSAGDAAKQQQAGTKAAMGYQSDMWNKVQGMLAPYQTTGNNANSWIQQLTGTGSSAGNGAAGPLGAGSLLAKFNPTMDQLASTPGYQFALTQGTQAVNHSDAARGLSGSGVNLADAAGYAQGLASTTYQQQFQNYWDQNKSILSGLMGLSQNGQNAANTLAGFGGQNAANMGYLANQNALFGASGTMGSANALSNGFNALTTGSNGQGLKSAGNWFSNLFSGVNASQPASGANANTLIPSAPNNASSFDPANFGLAG